MKSNCIRTQRFTAYALDPNKSKFIAYDNLNRLIQVAEGVPGDIALPVENYACDEEGNRTHTIEGLYPLATIDMMLGMSQNIFHTCLSGRPDQGDHRRALRWADFWGQRLASSMESVSGLLAQLDKEPKFPEDLLMLLSAVLDAMRMNLENREQNASQVFKLVEDWLVAKAASGSLDNPQKMVLCQAFIRAGLEPPDTVRINAHAAGTDEPFDGLEMPDIEALVSELIPHDVTGYPAYMILREGIGAMPSGPAHLLVTQLVAQAVPKRVPLGRYFLLDQVATMRVAAAEGFVALAHAGAIDAGMLSELIRLRKWLPDPETKSMLDRAIKEGLRREATGGAVPGSWRLHRLVSSLPDGTGSQSILASVSRGSQKNIATVLIKAGHGIKDAYAIPCKSASDQRQIFAEITQNMTMHEVPVDYLPKALADALCDGLVMDLPPAPGFIDVAEMLGQEDVVPIDPSSVHPLRIADPAANLKGSSVTKRGRLISQSIAWARDHDMSSSWFVTDATLSSRLEEVTTEHGAEAAVWAHLETLRDFWSSLFARSAAILRHAGANDWQTFAAVVQGLEEGRALKQIPIFEMIAALTLDVAEQGGLGMLGEDADFLEDHELDDDLDIGIEPEATGELGRLLRKTELSPSMIDGYLTAVIVAPRFVTPTDWLPPLFDEINLPGGNKLQRVLDIIMIRYGAIQDSASDGDIGSGIRKYTSQKFQDWLCGFYQATTITAAWPKRALSKDDKRILVLIKDGAQDAQIQTTLRPLLPSWLQAMAAQAVDG